MRAPIRVMIVDDSAIVRQVASAAIAEIGRASCRERV